MFQARHDKVRRVLVITASNDGRATLADLYREGRGYNGAESELAEAFHEAYEFVRPEDVPGAMTAAPILVDADDVLHPDNGEILILPRSRVFWFPDYCVEDPYETLKNRGRVEFVEAKPYADQQEDPPLVPANLADYLPGGERQGEWFLIGGSGRDDRADLPEPLRTLFLDSINDGRDLIDPGMYFVHRHTHLAGPFAPTWSGWESARKAGALEAKPEPVEPEQGVLC